MKPSRSERSLNGRMWRLAFAACAVLAGFAGPALALQPSPPAADATNGIWASFPKVDAAQPFLDYSKAWPARVGDGTNRGICIDIPGPTLRPSGAAVWMTPNALPAENNPDAKALFEKFRLPLDSMVCLEGERAFVVSVPKLPDGPLPPRRYVNPAAMTFRFVSARETTRDGSKVYALDHTVFTYFEPRDAAKPKALVLLLPGLLATPEGTLSGLTQALLARGYAVLRMVAQPARFVEHVTITVDPADPSASTGEINELFSQRLAECAYAAKGALDHLFEKRPELGSVPLAAIGFSGGAISLPTIVALEPARYKAAVLVGGGAHFWQMQEFSNYSSMIGALDITWTAPATDAAKQAIRDAYCKGVPLDPLHTAAALHGKPMLVIQGDIDLAVPSPLGDCLWERLGKPERWLEHAGHEDIFIHLPAKFGKIAAWLDGALGVSAAAPAKEGVAGTP